MFRRVMIAVALCLTPALGSYGHAAANTGLEEPEIQSENLECYPMPVYNPLTGQHEPMWLCYEKPDPVPILT